MTSSSSVKNPDQWFDHGPVAQDMGLYVQDSRESTHQEYEWLEHNFLMCLARLSRELSKRVLSNL